MRDLPPPAVLGLYALVLCLVFAAALGVGRAVGPVGAPASAPHASGPSAPADHGTDHTRPGAAR